MARVIYELEQLTKQELLDETRAALKTPDGKDARDKCDQLGNGFSAPSRASKAQLVFFISLYEGIVAEREKSYKSPAPAKMPLEPVSEPPIVVEPIIVVEPVQLNIEPVQQTLVVDEPVQQTVVVDEPVAVDEPVYENHDGLLAKAAQEYYQKLETYTLECLAANVKFTPAFFATVSYFRPTIERLAATSNAYSILNFKSQVLKRIADKVATSASQWPDDALTVNFNLFKQSVDASFSDLASAKVKNQNTGLNNRANNAVDVDVTRLLDWSQKLLANLPENASRWTCVATALMVLTGRRQSEIMSSGKFTLAEDGKLTFTGQLKRHQDDGNIAITIPVLCDPELVINAISWLDSWRKRIAPADDSFGEQQKAAKKAHDKYSRYLSQSAKATLTELVDIDGDWIHEGKDRRKCHLFRQIYGQVAYKRFYAGSGRKIGQVLTEILGHADSAGSRKFAAESYDADIFVVND
jgi:integrase